MATVESLTAACTAAGGTPSAADADVLTYIVAALADADGLEDAVDSFGELLVESGAVGSEAAARATLAALVGGSDAAAGAPPRSPPSPQRLVGAGLSLDELTHAYTKLHASEQQLADSDRVKEALRTAFPSDIDTTAASAKDLAKLAKRREAEDAAAAAAAAAHKAEAEAAARAAAPRIVRGRGGGGARDIKLDAVSVSNGGAELIADAPLLLAAGRRYGLVG